MESEERELTMKEDFLATQKLNSPLIKYLMRCVLLFPIVQLFEEIIPSLNKVLFAVIVLLLVLKYLFSAIKWNHICILISVFSVVLSLIIGGMPRYNINELFYFPFMTVFFLFFVNLRNEFVSYFESDKKYIKAVIWIYSLLILVALFLPNAFPYGTLYFKPYGLSGFRSSPTAVFIYVLVLYEMVFDRKEWIFASFVPLSVLFLGSSRTYLGVAFVLFLLSWYYYCKGKKLKFFLIGIIAVVAVFLLYSFSPVAQKNEDLISKAENGYFGFWGTVTSGRSVFWTADMDAYFTAPFFNKVFGLGLNYIYELNYSIGVDYIWAHNDFIQLLLDFGILGLIVYSFVFIKLFRQYRINKVGLFPRMLLILVWLINAFFNMFYTYFCSMLCYPILILINDYFIEKSGQKDEEKVIDNYSCL